MAGIITSSADFVTRVLDRKRDGTLRDKQIIDFFHFAYPLVDLSYSQLFQDLWVLYMHGTEQPGFFVEFGACDGLVLSNTALLELKYGWSGILAEPNPRWHADIVRNRKCNICFEGITGGEKETEILFDVEDRPELSRVGDIVPLDNHEASGARSKAKEIRVNCSSLNTLLDRYNAPEAIDFLSIDTEGSELDILESFDFSQWKVRLIAVEHAGDEAKRKSIFTLLSSKGFLRWDMEVSRWDDWYYLNRH
jgi:FkbM family methyltransferase